MSGRYEVQARLPERHGGRRVRDQTRWARSSRVKDAVHMMCVFAADRFTVKRDSGNQPVHTVVKTFEPLQDPAWPIGTSP